MTLPIKYLLLQKSELEYEVALRGGDIADATVVELRKQINKLTESIPSEEILDSHLDPEVDLNEATVSLNRAKAILDKLKIKHDKNLYNKAESLLHHLYYRLLRIEKSEADADAYSQFESKLNSQLQEFTVLKRLANQIQTKPEDSNELLTETLTVTCEKKMISDVLTKLKFSGKTCVRSFLQKVDDIIRSRNIPKEHVLQFAFEIFTDDALHWYRYIRHQVDTWDDVVALLKRDFSKSDYDYRLMSEIRQRTQGERENITIYISIMHGMFSRLDNEPTEAEKLEILLHNIRPCYASTMAASAKITTIEALADLCKSYEDIQSRMSHFHEPPRVTSETLAPEFAYSKPSTSSFQTKPDYNKPNYNKTYYNKPNYNKPNYSKNEYNKNYNTNYHNYRTNDEPARAANVNSLFVNNGVTPKGVYCPRCRNNTHSLGQCTKPRYPICFKCGKNGVIYPDCPVCQPNQPNQSTKN